METAWLKELLTPEGFGKFVAKRQDIAIPTLQKVHIFEILFNDFPESEKFGRVSDVEKKTKEQKFSKMTRMQR